MQQRTQDFHIQGPQINQFNNIAPKPIPRSSFKRDFTRRTTFNADLLIPIFLDEILPGDDAHVRMTSFTRMSTPIKPLMDNLYLETFWFFVPNRLVWAHWQNFQGQQFNPGDSVSYLIPVLDKTKAPMSTTGFQNQSIFDYFGLPTLVTNLGGVSCLFNRAYDLIWNEWFRDENLQNSYVIPQGDGPDDPGTYALRYRGKRKDYITSCLPWPQKGPAVTIPAFGGTLPVIVNPALTPPFPAGNLPQIFRTQTGVGPTNVQLGTAPGSNYFSEYGSGNNVYLDPKGTLVVDASTIPSVTINALRQAALYQQILELDARGGTRYTEAIYSRFGVVSPDFRLQRPELCGTASTRINIYSVPQTAPTVSGQTPQGNLAAFGTNVISGDHGCRYSATEHGMLIGLAAVRADITYQQALPKMFTRSTRLDFYEPLQNGLGEQAVLNQELYATGTATDTQAFGYQERFSEYRFRNSEVTGKFRSNDPQPLDVWHLAQQFGSLPALNDTFIRSSTPMSRVLAVPSEPSFLSDISFSYTHVRPMPIRSNPGIARL